MKLIDGKKTYIGAAIIFIAGGVKALCDLPVVGVCIDDDTYKVVAAFGGAVAVYGVRRALKKMN